LQDRRIGFIIRININLAAGLNKGVLLNHGELLTGKDKYDISVKDRFEVHYYYLVELF